MTSWEEKLFRERLWMRTGGTLNPDTAERLWPVGIMQPFRDGIDPTETFGGEWKELTYEEAMRLLAEEDEEKE